MSTSLQSKQVKSESALDKKSKRRPNETGTISVQAHMRIFDPKTQKTYVEGRA